MWFYPIATNIVFESGLAIRIRNPRIRTFFGSRIRIRIRRSEVKKYGFRIPPPLNSPRDIEGIKMHKLKEFSYKDYIIHYTIY